MCAIDHMMDIIKNYQAKCGAGAMWNVNKQTREIAVVVATQTRTAARDFAHTAKLVSWKPEFKPNILFSDTWPYNDAFWKMIFGDGLLGRAAWSVPL